MDEFISRDEQDRIINFYDRQSPEERKKILKFFFEKDIFSTGILRKEDIKGEALDLGCGRGAVGSLLKIFNPEIKITGVDIYSYQDFSLLKEHYEEFLLGNALGLVNQFKDEGRKFDLIISIGLPPQIIKGLIEEGVVKEILKPGGVIFLAYDIDIGNDKEFVESHGFNYFQGRNIIDRHMAVYRKSVD